ncbi:hypothetical protein [Serratia fonticola]|uniref:hypothetical protein n=1 Tax=Serratia fonticola TaxID=47917 RepID=UPI00301DEA8E
MSRLSQGKVYALSAAQHQHLSEKAVILTQTLNQPVACRHVLDAILKLCVDIDDPTLTRKVQQQLSEPRIRRKSGGRP